MPLTVGTRLGPYEILSSLGAGGMGEVYRARDTRLDRTVAIKILPETLASDPNFRERFEREARAISQLDHPHICTLYDVGEQQGTAYLVMQYLEGETLAARLVEGALSLDQALRYATEIAGALDRAHRSGIVHRDLKPANIMLTKGGAKLLDFGLAKSGAPSGGVAGLSMLPTTPPGLTAQGTILGTFQYMAPEQLEGQEADARTDIFAFGSVLYEMLTGRKVFQGKSQVSLIGAILKDDPPPIAASQPLAPPALDRVIRTCLAKDPDERWQSASDLQRELKWIADGRPHAQGLAPQRVGVSLRQRAAWIAAGVAIAAVVWLVAFFFSRTSPESVAAIRFQISPPEGTSLGAGPANPHQAISPDGRHIAFVVLNASRRGVLAVKALNELQAQVLHGTEGIQVLGGAPGSESGSGLPFWSPDSRFISFFAEGSLKKIEVTGGPVQILCAASAGEGGTWNRDGTILFAPSARSGLFRVSSAGGTPVPVTTLDASKKEESHRWPWFLPDGRHFLYAASASPMTTLYVGSLDSAERTQLFASESKAVYADGHLLFTRAGFLLAQPFDATRLQVTGESFPIAEDIGVNLGSGRAAFSVSTTGVLTYRTLRNRPSSQLVWFDRSGKQIGMIGEPANQVGPSLSPDGTRVAVGVRDPGSNVGGDLWIYDVARGVRTRFTFRAANEPINGAVWSPDGSRLIFNVRRQQRLSEVLQKLSSGAGDEDVVLADGMNSMFATSWSSDGRFILYDTFDGQLSRKGDLWVLPLVGERKPIPVLQTPFNELNGRFSPDGRWIAFQSEESGRTEVYVTSFASSASTPATGKPTGKWQVSSEGGLQPRWRRDGKEIFYISPGDEALMVATVNGQGSAFELGPVQPLFEVRRRNGNAYDVSADGQRFLLNIFLEATAPPPITVVVNWTAGIRR